MVGRVDEHKMGAGPAHLGTRHHKPEMFRLDMLPPCLQSVGHRHAKASLIATKAFLDACSHLAGHLRHFGLLEENWAGIR